VHGVLARNQELWKPDGSVHLREVQGERNMQEVHEDEDTLPQVQRSSARNEKARAEKTTSKWGPTESTTRIGVICIDSLHDDKQINRRVVSTANSTLAALVSTGGSSLSLV